MQIMGIKISKDIEESICNKYNNGDGTNELAVLFQLNRATIQRCLIRNNIILRKTSPYKKKYNVKFFDTYNAESCYWAGFILADGCVRSDRDAVEIHLKESDKEHLLKFAKAIGFTGNLVYDKYSKAYSISIAGKWFPAALEKNFSITKQKSLSSIFPDQVPKEYFNHLIRGIFDGDGCITKTTCATINFIGTNELLFKLSYLFFDCGVRLKSKNTYSPLVKTKNEKISHIHFSGKNAGIILDWLYSNSLEGNRLNRKYFKYMNMMKYTNE
jgi:hypothetical protein